MSTDIGPFAYLGMVVVAYVLEVMFYEKCEGLILAVAFLGGLVTILVLWLICLLTLEY